MTPNYSEQELLEAIKRLKAGDNLNGWDVDGFIKLLKVVIKEVEKERKKGKIK